MFSEITKKIQDRVRRLMNVRSIQDLDAGMLSSFLIMVAITLLSFEATDLFYKIISFSLTAQTVSAAPAGGVSVKNGPERQQAQDYSIITGRNVFQTTMKAAGGSETADGLADADQKAMDFDLKGTVACNPSCGFIVVEERGSRKQKLYKLGNNIGSNKLVKITRNAATLKSGEREITIKIKETVEGALLPGSPVPGRTAPAQAPSFDKRDASNLESIMSQAVVRPFMNKGVREGYVISNIAPNSLYEKAGLQNGDIISSINDRQMQNANDILQVLNSLQSDGAMRLNIKRRGKTETVNYKAE